MGTIQKDKYDHEKRIEVVKSKLKGKWRKWTELENERDEYLNLLGKKESENNKLKQNVKELQLKLDGKDVLVHKFLSHLMKVEEMKKIETKKSSYRLKLRIIMLW